MKISWDALVKGRDDAKIAIKVPVNTRTELLTAEEEIMFDCLSRNLCTYSSV